MNWTAVCEGLRKGKGFGVPPPSALPGIGGGFESAIGHANDDLFDGLGLVGVYAEYGPGQKAMVVLDKTQTDKFVLPSLRIFNSFKVSCSFKRRDRDSLARSRSFLFQI